MPDAGAGRPCPPPAVRQRRCHRRYENLVDWAGPPTRSAIDTMWLTEHHFQYEGYEVLPNLILFGLHLAACTEQLRFGQMFNVVPQWHPLRLAEDFALADIITGGRMEFGVGRGTVPREAWALGHRGRQRRQRRCRAEHDRVNREIFEEAMEVIKLAWYQRAVQLPRQALHLPPDGVPDRGATRERPHARPPAGHPVEIFQPVGVAVDAGVRRPAGPRRRVRPLLSRQDQEGVGSLRRGGGRGRHAPSGRGRTGASVDDVRGTQHRRRHEASPARAMTSSSSSSPRTGGSNQFDDGVPFDFRPTLEQTRAAEGMAIGSVEEVGGFHRSMGRAPRPAPPDPVPQLPGLSTEQVEEQLHILAEEVLPRAGVSLA